MAHLRTNKHIGFLMLLLKIFMVTITTTAAIKCPAHCKCSWSVGSLVVDCSRKALVAYPDFDDLPIEHLDLSHNHFTEFPKELADVTSLVYLDLSNNQIQYLDADALFGFNALRVLLLANNSFTSWTSLSPTDAFRNAIALKRLSLSGNMLSSFTDEHPNEILTSDTLTRLELQKCDITKIGGAVLASYLPNLDRLTLSGNTLTTIATMPSHSLRTLELSDCNLQRLDTQLLQQLTNLEVLNLAGNLNFQFKSTDNSVIYSDTLKELDVSYCNFDDIQLSGLPNLRSLHLQGNMLRSLGTEIFANSTNLEVLDVSRNSIRLIESSAFSNMNRLARLDLSYNEIARLDRNLFRSNDLLISLNLSRNVIETFTKLVSSSLRDINLSWCEIISIDITALTGLTSIKRVDLSNNLIRDFPGSMASSTYSFL